MATLLRRDREEQRYIYLEQELKDINTEYIALSEVETRRNTVILNEVLKAIVGRMKNNSKLFATMYRKEYYGGSYYDNLKVGKPDEYDLDLLLDFKKFAEPTLEISDIPGYVNIHLENVPDEFPDFERKLLDQCHYLSTQKVLSWMESVVAKAVNEFQPHSQYPYVKQIQTYHGTFYFTVVKQGPAFTLKLYGTVNLERVKIDIDLVPCFVLTSQKWPSYPYRQKNYGKAEFLVVPKKPVNSGYKDISTYWRLSFQEQEGVVIKNLVHLKPSLRLMKKLRDTFHDSYIASYYLKTIFLWEAEENPGLWSKPLSYVFMTMLKKYQQYIQSGRIPYFWNEENNLIKQVGSDTTFNVANRLQKIISDIELHPEDPTRVRWHLTRLIPESANLDFWSFIEDLPENKPDNSWCTMS